jgi:hypothetical protein
MGSKFSYLIIGSGRTSKHFSHYFQLLNLPFQSWNRHKPVEQLRQLMKANTHVLVLISDSAIEGFYREFCNSGPEHPAFIHFSGALEIPGMQSTHPLMTFSESLYDLETYRKIPFVTTSTQSLADLLPGLPNQAFQIRPEQKPFYHALCVMSGNFTTLLWQKMAAEMKNLGLPPNIHQTYQSQIFKNLQSETGNPLTGPIARRDLQTVISNDQALNQDPYQKIYRAFVDVYFPEASKSLKGGL